MDSISPEDKFGGTWVNIQNRFMYCIPTPSNATSIIMVWSGVTGGSKNITEANLSEHTHIFTGTQATNDLQLKRIIKRRNWS